MLAASFLLKPALSYIYTLCALVELDEGRELQGPSGVPCGAPDPFT
jgi:hypothetical protein